MTISATCPNGHKVKAKDSLAGKHVACPKCRAKFTIPMPGSDSEQLIEVSDQGLEPMAETDPLAHGDEFDISQAPLDDLQPTEPTPIQHPAAPRPASQVTKQQASSPKNEMNQRSGIPTGALIGLIGGGVALLLTVVIVVVVLARNGDGGSGEGLTSGRDGSGSDGERTTDSSGGSSESGGDAGEAGIDAARFAPGPAPQQSPVDHFHDPFVVSSEASLISEELAPEPEWSLDTDVVEPDALQPVDLPFQPRVWEIDETGRFLALLGEQRVSILSLPDFNMVQEIGFREAPATMSIGPEHLAVIHPGQKTVEVIDWQNGQSIGLRDVGTQAHTLLIRDGFLGVQGVSQDTSILDLTDLSVPPLVGEILLKVVC